MTWARQNAKLLLLIALLTVPILGALASRDLSGDAALAALGILVTFMVIALFKA